MKYIDTHAHYALPAFDKSRDSLLEEMHEDGLDKIISPAISYESNFQMKDKLGTFEWVYYAVGMHPNYVKDALMNNDIDDADNVDDAKRLMNLKTEIAVNKKVVAIGETGLDYHYLPSLDSEIVRRRQLMERQQEWFEKLLALAEEVQLPLILHIREAVADAIQILGRQTFTMKNPGVVHCFDGDYEQAKTYLDLGFKLGIGGLVTREEATNVREAVRKISIEDILLETDAPYIKPSGFMGSKNDSRTILRAAEMVAQVKDMRIEEVLERCNYNAEEVFWGTP